MSGLVLRLLCSAAVAGVLVVGRVMMTEIVPSDLKATSIGIANSLWMIGTPLGLFIGGHFVNYDPANTYRMISVIFVALFLLNVLAVKCCLVGTLVQHD